MKKGGFLRNVLDTIRSNQTNQPAGGSGGGATGANRTTEFGGQLKAHHFALSQVARHGFPEHPTALAFDPVQKIAAIGTRSGAIRVFGRPGVDVWVQHKPEHAVTLIRFVVNQGAIITVTADESVHLWSLRGPNLKLQFSANTSSVSPSSHSPAPGQIQSHATNNPVATTTSTVHSASNTQTYSSAQNADCSAQPGDPDYLADQLAGDQTKLASRRPEILHTLKFQREHITCLHQTLLSKWLYIGTERGNVHVANVETFELSGYSIAWNKAIELSRKAHPGSIIHISECPQDTNKLLIGYESGCIVLWDLKGRTAEGRYYYTENLLWLAWHYEGKQFVAAHGDGSLVTWQTRSNVRPAQVLSPHAKTVTQTGTSQAANCQQADSGFFSSGNQQASLASTFARALNNELYRPINKVEWKTSKSNEQFLLFSGGLPYDGLESDSTSTRQPASVSPNQAHPPPSGQAIQAQQLQQQYLKATSPGAAASPLLISPSISPSLQSVAGQSSAQQQQQRPSVTPVQREKRILRSTSLTVMYGKSITVLEMDETIIDFITICDNAPYENDTSDPYAVIVLLSNDLILIDLTSPGYPSFESPYPASSLNESAVTCVQYLADCTTDLIPFLYSNSQNVLSRQPKKGFSDKEWPINGGEWGQSMQSYPELVLTGHADGSIKFWDMSGVNFDLISKIRTSKLFERPSKLANSVIVSNTYQLGASKRGPHSTNKSASPTEHMSTSPNFNPTDFDSSQAQTELEENFFAIEKIEYCPSTKHLLVAGVMSQIIQFKLRKKEAQQHETATIIVDPPELNSEQNQARKNVRQHLLLKTRNFHGATPSSSGSSSSSNSHQGRTNGFHPELVCLTPMLVSVASPDEPSTSPSLPATPLVSPETTLLCHVPPKVVALSFQATHNM